MCRSIYLLRLVIITTEIVIVPAKPPRVLVKVMDEGESDGMMVWRCMGKLL